MCVCVCVCLRVAVGLQCVFSVNNNTVHHDAYLSFKVHCWDTAHGC